MTRDTRSDLLFAVLAGAVTYGLVGPVPAVVVAVVALLLAFGVRAPLSAVRDAAETAWDAARGVGSIRGASLSMRWVVVVFLAGVLAGRGFDGIKLPDVRWPVIDWPNIVVPNIVPEPTGPLTAAVVYETTEPLSRDQYAALYSAEVKSYIASHFDVRNGHAEWRIWDDDGLNLSQESPELRAAYEQGVKDASGKAWLVIRRGGETVHSDALPAGPEILATLKKYGGE